MLDSDLQRLAASSNGRYLQAVGYGVSAAMGIAFGALTWQLPPLPAYFFVYAGGSLLNAAIELFVRPDLVPLTIAFQHMPMHTSATAEVRLRFGEETLRMAAIRSRIARIAEGVIQIGVGVATVPIFLLRPAGFAVQDTWDVLVLVSAGGAIVAGLVGLLLPSEAELRWDAYQALRQLDTPTSSAARTTVRVHASIAPLRDGAMAACVGSF